MRKIFLLLLLLAGWAVIFSPLFSDDSARIEIFSSQARPSEKPLPQPWRSAEKARLSLPAAESVPEPPVAAPAAAPSASGSSSASDGSPCGSVYILQAGDTLGEIAKTCGVTLAELLSANPQIQNPNRIYSGQRLSLPDPLAGRGGGSSEAPAVYTASSTPGGFQPGALMRVDAANLPPNTPVRVGLGLSSSGYNLVSQTRTGADGRLSLTITLPASAQPGESGFILITTQGVPSVQRMSEPFTVEE